MTKKIDIDELRKNAKGIFDLYKKLKEKYGEDRVKLMYYDYKTDTYLDKPFVGAQVVVWLYLDDPKETEKPKTVEFYWDEVDEEIKVRVGIDPEYDLFALAELPLDMLVKMAEILPKAAEVLREVSSRFPSKIEEMFHYIGDFVTVKKASKLLKISEQTIRKMCRKGRIRAEKIGNMWAIPKEEIKRLKEELAKQ